MQQWNEIFKKEGKVFTKVQEDIPKVLTLFKKHNIKKILDLGCGSGRHVIYFTKRGFDVYGIDISKEGLNITKSWLKKEKLKANLKIGSVYEKLPYQNNFFDAIISVQVIHHARIKTIRKAIREIERILKPNGLIFITVRKRMSKRELLKLSQEKLIWKLKQIEPRTFLPLTGKEKGLLHYYFNKGLLRKEFKNFKIYDVWIDSTGHYCLLGELKD
ncbi:MAG: class I SAM-dependent methyltransferase [Elusimicrobiota bacterium]